MATITEDQTPNNSSTPNPSNFTQIVYGGGNIFAFAAMNDPVKAHFSLWIGIGFLVALVLMIAFIVAYGLMYRSRREREMEQERSNEAEEKAREEYEAKQSIWDSDGFGRKYSHGVDIETSFRLSIKPSKSGSSLSVIIGTDDTRDVTSVV